MKSWQLAVLGLALLTTAGCRSDPSIAILERDNYRKDREINQLRWQIEDLQEALNSCPEQSAGRERSGEDREPEGRSHRNHGESNGMKPPETEFGTPTSKPPKSLNPGGSLPSDIPDVPENIRNPTRGSSNDEGPVLEGDPDRFSATSRPRDDGLRHLCDSVPPVGRQPPRGVDCDRSGDQRRHRLGGRLGRSGLAGGGSASRRARQSGGRPGRSERSRIRSVAAGRGCPRGPLGFHPRRDRVVVLPHGQWRRDPFGDGLAQPPAATQQAAAFRAIRHGRRPKAGDHRASRDRLAGREDGPLDARRAANAAPSRRSNGSRRPIRGVRTRRRWRGVQSPRPTSPRVRPNRGPSGRSGRPSGDKLPLGRFAVSCYNSRSTPAVRRGRREDAAAEPIKGVMPCTYVLFSAV